LSALQYQKRVKLLGGIRSLSFSLLVFFSFKEALLLLFKKKKKKKGERRKIEEPTLKGNDPCAMKDGKHIFESSFALSFGIH